MIVAGGYAGGGVSGGAFNPAAALGLDLSSAGFGVRWSFFYLAYEVVGAGLAAALFPLSGTPGSAWAMIHRGAWRETPPDS